MGECQAFVGQSLHILVTGRWLLATNIRRF